MSFKFDFREVVPAGAKSASEPKPQEPTRAPFRGIEIGEPKQRTEEFAIAKWTAASVNSHFIFERGVRLRHEGENFVIWCQHMGEREGAKSWGTTQQTFAADWRVRHHEQAAELKKDIELEWPLQAQRVLDRIFGEEFVRYPATVETTAAARKELGL